MKPFSRPLPNLRAILATGIAAVLINASTQAATLYWGGGTTNITDGTAPAYTAGTWTNDTATTPILNWATDNLGTTYQAWVNANLDEAVFAGSGTRTITVGSAGGAATITAGNMQVTSTGLTFNLNTASLNVASLSGSGGAGVDAPSAFTVVNNTGNIAGAARTFSVGVASGTLIAPISLTCTTGSSSGNHVVTLAKSGAGTLRLSGTLTGTSTSGTGRVGLNVSAGTLDLSSATTTSAGNLNVTLSGTGILDVGGKTLTFAALTGAVSTATLTNSSATASTITLTTGNSATTFAGGISGNLTINKTDSGGTSTLNLTGPVNITGNLAGARGLTLNNATSMVIGGTVSTTNNGSVTLSMSATIGALAMNGAGVLALGANTLNIGHATTATTIGTGITGATGGALSKTGASVLTLTAANTYTGATSVGGGSLIVSGAGTLTGTTALNVSGGARFNYLPTSVGGTLTLGAASTLNLADNSTIGLAWNTTTANRIKAQGAATIGTVNGAALDLSGTFTSGTTYTVLEAGSGLDTGAYSLLNPSSYTAVIAKTATAVTVTPTTVAGLGTVYWKGGFSGGSTVWALSNGATASNWATDAAGTATSLVPGSGADVIISTTTPASAPTGTVLGANMSIKSLSIADTTTGLSLNADNNTLTIGTGGISVSTLVPASTLAAALVLGADQTWTNNSVNPLSVTGAVSGTFNLAVGGIGDVTISSVGGLNNTTGTLTKSGNGKLTLTTASVRTGLTQIDGGTLRIENSTAFGTAATPVTLNAGTLEIATSTAIGNGAGNITFNGGTILNALAGGTVDLQKTIALANSGTPTFALNSGPTGANVLLVNSGGNNRLTGGVAGASLQIKGSGTVNFGDGANTRTNDFIADLYLQGGKLSVRADTEMGNTANNLIFQAGTLVNEAAITTARTFDFTNVIGGAIDTPATTSSLILQTTGQLVGSGTLRKLDSGATPGSSSLFLNAGNTGFSGTVDVQGGRLLLGNNDAMGTGLLKLSGAATILELRSNTGLTIANAVEITANASFRNSRGNAGTALANSIGNLTIGAGVTSLTFFDIASTSITNAANTTDQVTTGTVALASTVTFNVNKPQTLVNTVLALGAITETGSQGLVKTGAGTLILSGANVYTGTTTLSAGTLSISDDTNLNTTASALVFDGGTLQVTGTTLTTLHAGRTTTFNATKTVGFDIADVSNNFTVAQVLNQTSGGLTKSGLGTLTLTNTNTFTGGTIISAGTLNVNADAALGDASGGVTMSGGATLQADGTVTTAARTMTLGAGGGKIDTNGQIVNLNAGSTVTGTSLEKTGAGTLNLAGTQTYDTLKTTDGTTNVNSALGTGTSTVNANATTNFSTSQTLAALNIGTVPLAGLGATSSFGAAAVVPEPGSFGLLVVGMLGILGRRPRRRA